jgi:hypothetical protein
MAFAVLLLTVLVLFLLAGAIPLQGDIQTVIFRMPLFILLVAVLAAVLIVVAARRPLSLKWAWFHLLHLGPVVIIAGALFGFVKGARLDLELPLSGERRAVGPEFSISATDFKVEYFDPSACRLFAPPAATNETDYVLVKTALMSRNGSCDFGSPVGRIPATALKDPDTGEWLRQKALPNGMVLQIVPPAPRHFAARLRFDGRDGASHEANLAVNHPVDCKGWRFYLISYDQRDNSRIFVSASRDPGGRLTAIGIWMVIAGAVLTYFRRKENINHG